MARDEYDHLRESADLAELDERVASPATASARSAASKSGIGRTLVDPAYADGYRDGRAAGIASAIEAVERLGARSTWEPRRIRVEALTDALSRLLR